jgi:hypothetical protein
MTPTRQTTLDKIEMKKHSIPEDREAFLFELDKVIEERCDEFDYQLEGEGYTIVSQDMEPAAVSIFNYKVIAYRE